MRNILVLDDDIGCSILIQNAILSVSQNYNIYLCQDISSAFQTIESHDIDLFFLDIGLSGMSGMEFAKIIRKTPQYAMKWIVFITAHDHYVREALDTVHCYAYLIKPFQQEAVEKIIRQLSRFQVVEVNPNYLTINHAGITTHIRIDDILYVEIMNKKIALHMANHNIDAGRLTLKKIRQSLPMEQFVQCHRSYIINRNYMKSIQSKGNTEALLSAGSKVFRVPIGPQYLQTLGFIKN